MSPEEYDKLVVELFRKRADLLNPQSDTELVTDDDIIRDPRLPGGERPRGLGEQGLVRTTGWLQVGSHAVSSGLVAAAIGLWVSLVAAIMLVPSSPAISVLCVLLLPVGALALWYLITTRLIPASAAHNTGTVSVKDLTPGMWIRLHGTIGPIGQVAYIQHEPQNSLPEQHHDRTTTVRFVGGASKTWPSTHNVHVAELHN